MKRVQGFYGIADADAAPDGDVVRLAGTLLQAGVATLQLRMKGRSDEEIRRTLRTLVPDSAKVRTVLVLNDHPALAAEFPGVGVHLGQADMPPADARALLGPERLLGWSTHTTDHLRCATDLPVDYVGFGPIYSAAGKHLHPDDRRAPDAAQGTAGLSEAVRVSPVPVVAIGGIDRTNLADVLATDTHAVAVIGAIAQARDPLAEARFWVNACRR